MPGGQVLAYDGHAFTWHGHRVALIGGRAYCSGCNSIGTIAKAGGPRRPKFISEVALEGDVVMCHCASPQPILSNWQSNFTHDDGMRYAAGAAPALTSLSIAASSSGDVAFFKAAVDKETTFAPDAQTSEKICPSMTNKVFCDLMLRLRDRAVDLISKKRIPELVRWDRAARTRVIEWFGIDDEATRRYLLEGFRSCERVLSSLDCSNFVRYSEGSKTYLTCTFPPQQAGTMAAVCKPDVATHTIAFTLDFCDLREFSMEGDSKLLTLIHEVTHFDDCFGSLDAVYHLSESRKAVATRGSSMKFNADSLAGYVVWGESYAG